ncbi:MAG: hypothetical protein IJS39_14920 [Synergistaceae bacterium]|nr:hypothetical protein [Synergistaceae bacterium]
MRTKRFRAVFGCAAVVLAAAAVCMYYYRRHIARMLIHHGIIDHPHYAERMKEFQAMPRTEGSIVFLGDSITDLLDFGEVLPSYHIINRGISGDTTSGVLRRLGEVISLRPRKLFLLIGTNDLGHDIMPAPIARNIREIVSRVQEKSPSTRIYLQAVFPTRHDRSRPNALIQELNAEIKAIAQEKHCTFIDLYPLLLDAEGLLAEEYTLDGLHLSDSGNAKWMAHIVPYLDE